MKILIVEDHQMIIDFFIDIFKVVFEKEKCVFTTALNCEEAVIAIDKSLSNNSFDFALIDVSMPSFNEREIYNGIDVCNYLKQKMPSCKTLINTGIIEHLTLFEITQNFNIEGIAIKSDMKHHEYFEVIQKIWKGEMYRSKSVHEKVEEIWQIESLKDKTNRAIINKMVNGYKIKDIAIQLHLTEAAINKRISQIKSSLNIKEKTIVQEIKHRGYL